ncbi:MAG TPA: NUDIX domain-containing protein [Bacillota bacterium]|nr:NUDIX domain-containing protein [Bacillota bacterium]
MIHDDCAGGLVFWKDKLVILQRFNGVWLFPKGHIDPGETPEQAAVREVKEECGLTAVIVAPLGETGYSFRENGVDHQKKVQWYLMKADAAKNQIQLEAGFFTGVKLIEENELEILSYSNDRVLALQGFRIYQQVKEELS